VDPEIPAEGPCQEMWTVNNVNGMAEVVIDCYVERGKTLDDFVNGFPISCPGSRAFSTPVPRPAPY